MRIRALKHKNVSFGNRFAEQVADRWNYEDMLADPAWRKGWISFDCCLYLPEEDRVYCGITSFDADIFWAYDRKQDRFMDCGFSAVRDPYDAKFHRSLVRYRKDGCIYAAIALLHDVDRYWRAPGGAIVRYDPLSGSIEKVAVPLPHVYIQSICLDQESGTIFGQTLTPERMFRYRIGAATAEDLGPIGSGAAMAQGENIEMDSRGRVWCGWNALRAWQSEPGVDSHRLCRFDPHTGEMRFFKTGLPMPDGRYGTTRVEGLFNLGKGMFFASGGNGSLYRVDEETGAARYLGTPIPERRSRLACLRMGPDGTAYGVTGRDGNCELLRFDPRTETYRLMGTVVAGDERCWQVHDVAILPDGTIYACENDNPFRSGYLWEIRL